MTHKSVPQECPTRRRVAAERSEWWSYGICLRTCMADPFSVVLTQRERHQELGAPEPDCCAAVSSARARLQPLTCERHRRRHTKTQT